MQMIPVPAAKRRHQASRSKKANFLSFSHPLSAELLTPWGEVLHCSILQRKLAELHIQLLACLCCFSLGSQAKSLTTLLHLASFPHPWKLPQLLCFISIYVSFLWQLRRSTRMGDLYLYLSVCHGQAQWNLRRNIPKCIKKSPNFITVCMARLKFRGKLLGF